MIHSIFAAPKGGDLAEGIRYAIDQGLNYELPTFYYPYILDNADSEIEKFALLLKDFQGTLSMHGPIFDMNPVSLDPGIAEVSRQRYQQAIAVAKRMNVKYLVFHSQYTPIYTAADCLKPWMNSTIEFFESLLENELADSNLTLLLENYLDETPIYLKTILSRINHPQLRCCLDIGHVNIFSQRSPLEWLEDLGNFVVYIHAHNNHGALDNHLGFQQGSIDMAGFLSHLALTSHRVHLAVETGSVSDLKTSHQQVLPYLEMQSTQLRSKSFLV